MFVTRLRSVFPLALFVVLTGALALGCGGATIEDVCNTCPSDGKLVAACVVDGAEEQSRADQAGCGPEFQALLDCAEEKATCGSDGRIEAEACDPEADLVEKCIRK